MRALKIPNLTRSVLDASLTLTYQQPKYSLLWMHGYGDHPDSYLPFFTHHLSPLYLGCRIKLLQAPKQMHLQSQTNTNAWYEPRAEGIDINQINDSLAFIQTHFNQEVQYWRGQANESKIAHQHRIYIGGMGQGATIALHYTFTSQLIPAGVIALSGSLLKETSLKNKGKVPALLMHGHKDLMIRQIEARQSYSELLKDQFLVEYKTFNELEHGVSLEELQTISRWIGESHQFIKKHYQSTSQ